MRYTSCHNLMTIVKCSSMYRPLNNTLFNTRQWRTMSGERGLPFPAHYPHQCERERERVSTTVEEREREREKERE
jgi:hypothetical protein